MKVIKLQEQFSKGDCDFIQLEREGNKALYQRTYRNSGVKNYEVITVKASPSLTVTSDGTFTKNKEVLKEYYPSDEQFGQNGWWFTDYQRAKEYYDAKEPVFGGV